MHLQRRGAVGWWLPPLPLLPPLSGRSGASAARSAWPSTSRQQPRVEHSLRFWSWAGSVLLTLCVWAGHWLRTLARLSHRHGHCSTAYMAGRATPRVALEPQPQSSGTLYHASLSAWTCGIGACARHAVAAEAA